MPAFLIEYHRPSGRVSCERYDSLLEATRERLHRDKENFDPDLEIVAIAAADEASLRVSHSRYFSAA